MYKYKEITNQRFGKLLVLSKSENKRGKERSIRWNCLCDCGTHVEVSGTSLRAGAIISCGCTRQDKERILARSKKIRIDGFERAVNSFLHRYKQQANLRNYDWNLSRETFIDLIQQDCTYCGTSPDKLIDVSVLDEERVFLFNGIDRVDNSIGYIDSNVVPCCSKCNYMKNSFTISEFLEHIQQIYVHQSKKQS